MTDRMLRVGLRTEDPYLAEQVRRVVDAAGALLADPGDEAPDVWLIDGDAGAPAPPGPVIRVRLGSGRPPVVEVGTGVIHLPSDAEPLLRHLSLLAAEPRARTVGVVGVRGGVGASTLAAAVARASVRAGVCTALVELHTASGGLDLLLGAEGEPGPRWADLRSERGGFPAAALAAALPRWRAVRILSGDRRGGPEPADPGVPDALRALASAHDALVLDLPRDGWWGVVGGGTGGPVCDVVVLVATCDVRSAVAATLLARAAAAEIRLVVRRRPRDGLHPEEVADACDLPLVAVVPTERGGAAAADRGEEPGDRRGLARAARRLVASLALVP